MTLSWPKSDQDHLLVTAAQMSSLEGEMIQSGIPVASLMEKVGLAVARWLLERPELLAKGVVVLVGPGHNGGDGLVVARELHLSGVNVEIWCPLPIREHLTSQHLSHAIWLGIPTIKHIPDVTGEALWIEALFGLGQSRPLPESIAKLLDSRQKNHPRRLICIDVPAGLCSDSGRAFCTGAAVGSFTLAVGLIKQGLVQDKAIENVGHLVRVDIGLSDNLLQTLPDTQPRSIHPEDFSTVSWPKTRTSAMKYQRGRVLVIAGSDTYPGASLIALKGALASGVGSIRASVPNRVSKGLWKVVPEIILSRDLEPSSNGGSSIGNSLVAEDLARLDAVLIGPGLGSEKKDWSQMAKPLVDFPGLLVLDADALNRLASSVEGWEWLKKRQGPSWITPHSGEFSRLFPELKDLMPLNAALEAAKLCGIVVLLKGAHSVVADPKGFSWQLSQTASWTARIGLGDLLAGYATGLGALGLASGLEVNGELLAKAAFLHAEAARNCRKGSSAGSIVNSLEALTTSMQSGDCTFSHKNL